MIYQQGKLIFGEDNIRYFTGFYDLSGSYISKNDNWLTGVLLYDQTGRNICFFPSRWPKIPKKKKVGSKIKQAKPITEKNEVIVP